MIKSIVSWVMALIIGTIVVWMFWSLLVYSEESFFDYFFRDFTAFFMFCLIIFIVAIPAFMIVRKKLFK